MITIEFEELDTVFTGFCKNDLRIYEKCDTIQHKMLPTESTLYKCY